MKFQTCKCDALLRSINDLSEFSLNLYCFKNIVLINQNTFKFIYVIRIIRIDFVFISNQFQKLFNE